MERAIEFDPRIVFNAQKLNYDSSLKVIVRYLVRNVSQLAPTHTVFS